MLKVYPLFLLMQLAQVNYDESKVGAYTLPNPLILQNGDPVRTSADWETKRRPEILKLFETNMYGRVPVVAQHAFANHDVVEEDRHALGGKAIRKQVLIKLPHQQFTILLYLPQSSKPVPVFLALNFTGNHTILPDPAIELADVWDPKTKTHRLASPESRGSSTQWQVEKLLARGYGLATVYYQDIEPDFEGGIEYGIRAPYPRPTADEWGSIAAWALGLTRAMDYLTTDYDVDSKRVILMGHSRLGKTALWAAANDPRFAIVIAAGSGEGGAALSRRDFGETIELLNKNFPYWTCANYKKYSNHADRLPFDQHELLALIAPRPLYLAAAEDDKWADPQGEFLSAKAAGPVYELFGKQGLEGDNLPPLEKPVMNTIGFHIRRGKHEVTAYDWDQFLNFADKNLPKAP
jgi:pimeloyl-ACP methyl ester carboxylesterase